MQPDTPTQRKGRHALIVVCIVAVVIAIAGIVLRVHEGSALDHETRKNAVTPVVVMKAAQGPANEAIVLPGTVQAWHEAPIYARTSGYLKDWKTDIGAPVKAGDVLADIDTPEVDAQLAQAKADLATAEANDRLAQITQKRWENLLKTNSVSKQEADEKAGAAAASAANVAAAKANVDRLQQMEDFKQVTAPFDGVITARNTDTGALINAGSGGTALQLFHIAETAKLRVYVQVPETYAHAITPDIAAEVRFADHPGETFPAKLAASADALDPGTRTLLIQLELDNAKGELLPGGYAEVHIKLPTAKDVVRLPVNTLLFRSEGLQIATIDGDSKAVLKPIVIGRDYGKDVEVRSGVKAGDIIIVNPPDSIANGQPLRVVTPGKDGDDKDGDDKKSNKDGSDGK